jgi:hypothetical protein
VFVSSLALCLKPQAAAALFLVLTRKYPIADSSMRPSVRSPHDMPIDVRPPTARPSNRSVRRAVTGSSRAENQRLLTTP